MKLLKILLVFLFVFSLTSYSIIHTNLVRAQSDAQLQQIQDQINQYSQLLNQARGQERTLQSELNFIDAQTKITELKIQQTNYQISKLEQEITDLSGRITRVSTTLDSTTNLLLNQIVSTYKYSNVSGLDLIFSSHGFSDLLERIKYIEVAQAYDKKLLYQLQATKSAYNDQKSDKETRQAQELALKTQLADYSTQLDQQKAAKAQLLKITQNNEAVYQQKLQAALAEQQAILSLENGGGTEVSEGPVHTADVIGHFILGSSACSSGSHLHFEVHVNNNLVNPTGFLSNTSFTWDDQADSPVSFSGSWPWPIFDPIYIEQPFGNTWYAQHGWYTNPPGHTGVDMYSPSSSAVKAVHDGTLSSGSIACGGGTLHYKRIDHGDGNSSYYLHVL